MFSMRKALFVGATVGAAGLIAMSTAWACTGYDGTITVTPGSGNPGDPIDVFGRGYIPGNGPIQIRWDSTTGTVLGTATGESFTAAIKVPATAPARVHFVVAVQRKADGGIASQSTVPFEVLAAETPVVSAPSTDVQQPTTDAAPATLTPAPADPGAPLAAIPVASPALAAQPATAPARPTAPAAAAPSPASATPAQPGTAPAAVPSPAVAGPAPDGATAAPVVTPVPDDAPADIRDLWSGLARDPVGPSLTAPVPGRPDANPPLAVGLLTLGVIGLGAGVVGVAQARRRGTEPARAPGSRHDRQP